jgi:hypothetical protein
MKKLLTGLALSFLLANAQAQIIRTNIAEHFTNSNCGVCAFTNSNIYTALNAQPNVLHITFYPSSPYANCVFSMQNSIDNDARTNFYNIYGGTPKVIANGSLVSNSALGTTLTSSATATTNFKMDATQIFHTIDSVEVTVIIKKIAADTTTTALLFVGAKQDSIMQTTGNGESLHRDVFRKSLTSITGNSITMPTNINDSIIIKYNYKVAANWTGSRMQTIAILQRPNKNLINAAQSVNVLVTPPPPPPTPLNQIVRTSIVEHFTNSNCGVCANTNPSIYTTLNNNPNVLHITFHPSSPYANCVFSAQNPIENDARTNYYGIYGSTPRVVANGAVINTTSLASNLSAAASAKTSFKLNATQKFYNDSVEVIVVIKKIELDSNTSALLFVGAKQDSIMQTSGNGESLHQDVFRKALTQPIGNSINLPLAVNDSLILKYNYKVNASWNAFNMQSIAILQQTNKSLLNAAQSINLNTPPTPIPAAISNIEKSSNIFPNPANQFIQIDKWASYRMLRIYNAVGQIVLATEKLNSKISVENLPSGFYNLQLIGERYNSISPLQIIR